MSQADIFAALQSGAKFDRQRFHGDISRFKLGAAGQPPLRASLGTAGGEAQGNGAAAKRKQKKRKAGCKEQRVGAEVEIDEGMLLFNSKWRKDEHGTLIAATPDISKSKDPMEEANSLRKAHRIRVTGSAVPDPLKDFVSIRTLYSAPRRLLANLEEMRFADPTPIQRQATTALMEERELLAVAPTGSGKTMAFLPPIVLSILRRQSNEESQLEGISALIISPTRELTAQTARCLSLLTTKMKIRGVVLSKSTAAGVEYSKVDILLATPLRLKKLVEEERLHLSTVRNLVLDEADRLFDLGFLEQVDEVIAACSHPGIVRALFSATLPEKVEELARNVLRDPVRITVGERNTATAAVKQELKFVGNEEGRTLALRQLLRGGVQPPVLVFVASKERAQVLYKQLMYDGFHIDCIHSDQSQAARGAAINSFRSGRTWVLIATDLIGRGMDFIGVNTVVNFDFPNSTIDYIHRIGRTGRGGQSGIAVTFFTEDDSWQLRSIANMMRTAGCEVPEWMLTLKKTPRRQQRGLQQQRQQKQRQDTEKLRDAVLPKFEREKKHRKHAIVAATIRKKKHEHHPNQ